MSKMEYKRCNHCGNIFYRNRDSQLRWNNRLYCCRKCNDDHKRKSEKTKTVKMCLFCKKEFNKIYEESWEKWANKKFCSPDCANKGKKRVIPKSAFKKGQIPHNYSGDKCSYMAVHQWLRRNFKKSGKCSSCGRVDVKTQWANKSGKYLRDIQDYIELCRKCHEFMDRINPKRPKI
jgi:hypothetical protein